MKKRALQCLVLTGLFLAALCRWNTYVHEEMEWSEAREYCMKNHTDLTSISNEQEDTALDQYHDINPQIWIGLHKDKDDDWKWAGGENATYFRWAADEGNGKDKNCVVHSESGWQEANCDKKHTFFCFDDSLVLVEEKKTWEEAMESCRYLNKHLVSLDSQYALFTTLQASQGAQTEHVWTGLRYLGDSWLWVSGHPVGSWSAWSHVKAPQCPDWVHRCGALSLEGEAVEGWDCADKLNFVCGDR